MSKLSLQQLFDLEKETHLTTLAKGMRCMATEGWNAELSRELFRAAHSLKGAARLVRNKDVEDQAHSLEEILKQSSTTGSFTEALLNDALQKVDALGGRTIVASPCTSPGEKVAEKGTGAALHITSEHISELLQHVSELAVLSRRMASAIQQRGNSVGERDLIEGAENLSTLAGTVEKLTYRMRLAPLHETTSSLPAIIEGLAGDLQKKVTFSIVNGNTLIDRDLLRRIEPCLIQLIKNCVDHAIELPKNRLLAGKSESGKISLIARKFGAVIELELRDDGAGIDLDNVRRKVIERGLHASAAVMSLSKEELLEFLFLPGFSTKEKVNHFSGRGVGLDIVKATLQALGGDVSITTGIGTGTSFHLRIPSQIASFRALIFKASSSMVAVPLAFVERALGSDRQEEVSCGRRVLMYEGEAINLVKAHQALRLAAPSEVTKGPVLVLCASGKRVAIEVESIVSEQEIVVQPLDSRFANEQRLLGITSNGTSEIVSVLNVEYFVGEPLDRLAACGSDIREVEVAEVNRRILIVDDSLTVRELERQLLLEAGFSCDLAVDGLDGLEKAQCGDYALIITDVDMPRLNGFGLLEKIQSHPTLSNTPTLVVSYKDRAEDKETAFRLGARSYLSKGSFKDESFITTVRQLLMREVA